MATEKPQVLHNTFETAIAFQYDAEGKIKRDEKGKPLYETKKFSIDIEYPTIADLVKAAAKYSTWKVQGKVRAHYWPNKKTGKTTPYGLLPGTTRKVDPEGTLLKDLDDEIAELKAKLEMKLIEKAEREAATVAEEEIVDVDEETEEEEEEENPNGK